MEANAKYDQEKLSHNYRNADIMVLLYTILAALVESIIDEN